MWWKRCLEYWRKDPPYIGVDIQNNIIACSSGDMCSENEFHNKYIGEIWMPILKTEDRHGRSIFGYDIDNKEFRKAIDAEKLRTAAKAAVTGSSQRSKQ